MLLDTCIIIDYLRGKPEAIQFLEQLDLVPAVATTTICELYGGVKGKQERTVLEGLLISLNQYDLDADTAQLAGELWQQYRRSHGTDIIDAMIAATAIKHALPFATVNLKHFPMLPNLQRPY